MSPEDKRAWGRIVVRLMTKLLGAKDYPSHTDPRAHFIRWGK